MTALTKEEILQKCSVELVNSRDCQAIADTVNINRTASNSLEMGNGTIVEILADIDVANTLLDFIHAQSRFKYIVPLLEQGRLKISNPLVATVLNSVVPSILTQDQANMLIAKGFDPDLVSVSEVANVLYNPDGSMKA